MASLPSNATVASEAAEKMLSGLIDFLTFAKAGVTGIGIVPGLEPAVNGVLQFLTMIEVHCFFLLMNKDLSMRDA
jgi:hypothetical protein